MCTQHHLGVDAMSEVETAYLRGRAELSLRTRTPQPSCSPSSQSSGSRVTSPIDRLASTRSTTVTNTHATTVFTYTFKFAWIQLTCDPAGTTGCTFEVARRPLLVSQFTELPETLRI